MSEQVETKKSKLSIKDIVIQLAFLAVGIGLFIYVISKFDFEDIVTQLSQAKIIPIVLVILVSLLGHFIRSLRWKLLMDHSGKANFWNLLFSMQFGYFISLAIPRIGEFIKCFISGETEKKPFSYVFGTMMSERIVDLIILFLLVICAFVFYDDILFQFWAETKVGLLNAWESKKYYIIGGLVLVFVILLPAVNKVSDGEKNEFQLMEGMKTSLLIKQKGLFIVLTLGIWTSYFLTSYLLFFSFTETSTLGLGEGFITMISGTVSRMLPINGGGIGAYHYVTETLLSSLNISGEVAISYALLNHGIQFIFQIVVGIIAVFFLSRKIKLSEINLKI